MFVQHSHFFFVFRFGHACTCVYTWNSSCASNCVYDHARIQEDLSKTLDIQAWYLHGVLEGAEVTHLSAKHKVTQLRIREKDDEEHDCKSANVFGALRKRKKTNTLLCVVFSTPIQFFMFML